MNIIIESPFTLTAKDKEVIEAKINDLKKYESTIIQVNVYFKTDSGSIPDSVLSEIRILLPGYDLFTEKSDEDAMIAFSMAYNSIKRKVKERRKKLYDHKSPGGPIDEIEND